MPLVEHAPVIQATVERPTPAWQPFGPDKTNLLARYVSLLDHLGLDDPTTASMKLQQAVGLRDTARHLARPRTVTPEKSIADQLAAGDITPAEAKRLAAKRPSPDAARESSKAEESIFGSAALSAFRMGLRELYELGEANWLDLLRPIADEAVKTRNDPRWVAVHALAKFLRAPEVAGLSRGSSGSRRSDLPAIYYQFAHFDLAHLWQLDHAEKTMPLTHDTFGRLTFIQHAVRGIAPIPSMKNIKPDWGAGLFSATEAMTHADAVEAKQNRDVDNARAEVPEKPRRRAMVAR